MTAANISYFQGAELQQTYLKVRGFLPCGARSGGIKDPKQVEIPVGSVLLRTYHDPARLYGEWWFTPYEMAQVVKYFGRGGAAFSEGRSQGKGILQAALAVRHEWGGCSPDHLGLVASVRLTTPLQAFFGEGDVAPDASQKQNLKPIFITDAQGRRRSARQLLLPEAYKYQPSFAVLERECPTDVNLIRLTDEHGRAPLPFEN